MGYDTFSMYITVKFCFGHENPNEDPNLFPDTFLATFWYPILLFRYQVLIKYYLDIQEEKA